MIVISELTQKDLRENACDDEIFSSHEMKQKETLSFLHTWQFTIHCYSLIFLFSLSYLGTVQRKYNNYTRID